MTAYDTLFSRVLVRTDAETAHHSAFRAIRAARPVLGAAGRRVRAASPPVHAMGITFPGVLGLAAGFDKNAQGVVGWAGANAPDVLGRITQPAGDPALSALSRRWRRR